ncbi:hypothetical protein ACFVXC_19685 [Streptomyces sp. NPDC058257]|uniref:hypothetical protein n=1 Tax=Streptomyces sp. NPDC058257 TaxID=3346409 RepID=UPI0036E0D9B1
MIVQVGMKNAKRAVIALTLATAALAATGSAHASDGNDGHGGINIPESPGEVVDGVRTGLDVAATSWEIAHAR